MDKIKEAGFHIAARKETDLSKDMAEQFYQDLSDKEYYGDLVDHMTRWVARSHDPLILSHDLVCGHMISLSVN